MSDTTKPKLTARELELAGLVWQCFDTEPKVNYVELARIAGFKNSGTASACWGPVKKKLMALATGVNTKSPKSTKVTPKAGKRQNDTRNDEDGEGETPTKRRRVNASAKKSQPSRSIEIQTLDGDEDDNAATSQEVSGQGTLGADGLASDEV